ncbi:uncharacterized protein C8R40DRAFT_1073303 [Lentinula edodes]|uniref:uncharacterized protein n=1 Tax=Lentinula edodes TaxID=5353 RepID=UPI001E8CB2AE|nr:uncharacterized protein C8R40DRAFT_1073303 [Lentinula edodes]KAH7870410.1 hypothetical protein C8R40DRAFT_1073303 [Lentinula edodes]
MAAGKYPERLECSYHHYGTVAKSNEDVGDEDVGPEESRYSSLVAEKAHRKNAKNYYRNHEKVWLDYNVGQNQFGRMIYVDVGDAIQGMNGKNPQKIEVAVGRYWRRKRDKRRADQCRTFLLVNWVNRTRVQHDQHNSNSEKYEWGKVPAKKRDRRPLCLES